MCVCLYVCVYVCMSKKLFKLWVWTRTSRSHDISGPVDQMSVLVVLDGGACPGALHAPAPRRRTRSPPSRTSRRAAPRRHHATPAQARQARRARHTIRTTRVVLYPTIRQWNGCPSDKRQLVWCVGGMLLEGGRVGAAGPSRPSTARPGRGRDVPGLGYTTPLAFRSLTQSTSTQVI